MAVHEKRFRVYPQSSILQENLDCCACTVKLLDDSSVSDTLVEEHKYSLIQENIPYIDIDSTNIKMGFYDIICHENTSNEVVFNTTIEVVDSGSFTIASLSPEMVTLNVPFKVS